MTKHTQKKIKFEDPDPFDGLKAIGCLITGIIIIAIFISATSFLISQIRQKNEKTRIENTVR